MVSCPVFSLDLFFLSSIHIFKTKAMKAESRSYRARISASESPARRAPCACLYSCSDSTHLWYAVRSLRFGLRILHPLEGEIDGPVCFLPSPYYLRANLVPVQALMVHQKFSKKKTGVSRSSSSGSQARLGACGAPRAIRNQGSSPASRSGRVSAGHSGHRDR